MHLTLMDFRYANCCRDIERWKAGTPGTRPLSVLLVGDEHDLIVDDALQMPVGALAITLSGLHELAARDPTVLERDLPPRLRWAGPERAARYARPPPHY